MRHARGTTVGEVENQLLTKLVLNTSQAHFNEHAMAGSPLATAAGVRRSSPRRIVVGLATHDRPAEHALAEGRAGRACGSPPPVQPRASRFYARHSRC
jgi:hypothetical protein